MLHIQRFLSEGGSFSELLAKYAIKAKRHPRHPNLVLFKYNQIESPFAEEIVRECRGIILDESDSWRIVSRAFNKFFNHGEGRAAELDWSTARVQEKVDGSLCVMYWYGGEWHVATSGTPDAGGDLHMSGELFRDMFWRVFESSGLREPTDTERCYYFELTSPANRIVVVHREPSLTLLGARNLDTQQEVTASEAAVSLGDVRTVREFPLRSFDEIAASFQTMNPLEQEGYVVVDGAYNRVKVKHPGYVALHHARDGISLKAFVEIARNGETSEVIAAFPEFKPMLDDAKERVSKFTDELETAYDRIKDIEIQKDFALQATKARCSGPLFLVRAKKKPSIKQAVADMRIDNLMELLGYKDEPVAVVE